MNNKTKQTTRKRRPLAGRIASEYMKAMATSTSYNSLGYPYMR